MALSKTIKEKISMEVIKTLVSRFDSFPEDAKGNRNAPFHEAFLNAFSDKLDNKVSDIPFFISLSSWLQGLNTTLGQTFFENVANILCGGEKKEYTSKREGILQITSRQEIAINEIITGLSNSELIPNLKNENSILFQGDETELKNSIGFSADVFFIKDNVVNAIELKSVKPNSGEMRGEKQKILHGKAALYKKYHGMTINFFLGFPFDPTVNLDTHSKDSYDKKRFVDSCINLGKYFASEEILIAKDLWDFLSDQNNTMNVILEIINNIATPHFLSKFKYLRNVSKRNSDDYKVQLRDWNLNTEIELIENISKIKENSNNAQLRILNKNCFNENGDYDWSRAYELKCLI